jgi:alkyl hydroperoxide reductase subunit D
MSIESLKTRLPDYAKDLRLNLGTVLSTQGSPGLSEVQIWSVALATAIAARNVEFARGFETLAREKLDSAHLNAARAAAAIMGMNNVYYRFLHLVEDREYQTLPARLRMNVIANPGIPQDDF